MLKERVWADLPELESSSVKHQPQGNDRVCGFDGIIQINSEIGVKKGENGCSSLEPPRKMEEGVEG